MEFRGKALIFFHRPGRDNAYFSKLLKLSLGVVFLREGLFFRGLVPAWFRISCIQHCTSKGSTWNLFHDYLNNLKSIITLYFPWICSTSKHFCKSFVRPTNSIPRGLILGTNIAEVSLFVNTTTQAVTCVKRKIKIQPFRDHFKFVVVFLWGVVFWNVTGSVAWHPWSSG